MTKKARLFGSRIDLSTSNTVLPAEVSTKFKLKNCVQVSATRSNNSPVEVEFDDNDLLALQFTDDTEWIGHPEDIQEIYNEQTLSKRATSKEDYLFEVQISTTTTDRGALKSALVKVFSVFGAKSPAKTGMKALGIAYDKKVQPAPGLYEIDASFKRTPFKNINTSKPCLLLLHGTLSTTIDAFGGLQTTEAWSSIVEQYQNNIIALEHYTLSKSPLHNVLDFLKSCPDDCTFDILSHSRGGLIADILAKCDSQNKENHVVGFSKNELLILERHDKVSHKLMSDINKQLSKKRITIGTVVRVAAPSSGTTILSERADHFFNLLLNAISLAFGIRNPMYSIVKSFLLELISQKEDPEVLPGLNSMMPESLFQKMMNAADTEVVSDLYTISGDAEVGGLNFNSLKVILANLFYRNPNDLVVDTDRMLHGVKRVGGTHTFLSQDSETNHFNYFKNRNSCAAILQGLGATNEKVVTLFKQEVYNQGQRGILLDKLSLDGINFQPEKITRDVVILLPGIMGSTLEANGQDQWVQMRNINQGAISDYLKIDATNVTASGIIEKYYSKLGTYLEADYDVISLAFDWRASVSVAATDLKDCIEDLLLNHTVNIHIIAHSMGGLVARQCMIDHPKTWGNFNSNGNNKYIMLGTPWLGSYLIMEVLTGHSRRVKQLAAIDFKNNKKDLLAVFWEYTGVFELLPIEKNGTNDFWDFNFWTGIHAKSNLKHMPKPNQHNQALKDFAEYRDKIQTFLSTTAADKEFFKNIYYICGKADKTVFDYTFKDRWLSSKKKLVYKATSEGDGSVTWETGIPTPLVGSSNLYYSHTTHGELANEQYIFEAISDILYKGKTSKLPTEKPTNRGGALISEIHEYPEPLTDADAVVNALFGSQKTSKPAAEKIHVKVINGDLKIASYPVMVGHFYMDLILSAEKALDRYLNDRLSQRLDIGYYPGKIGESEVFFNLNTQPKGAIVCGLGTTDTLTTFLLSKTVKLATLKYAMFMRDNYTLPRAKKHAHGISVILIGIGYGKLAIEDSLRGILLGISEANNYIKETGQGLQTIKELEVLNFYESVASQAYFSLSRMLNTDNRISIKLDKGVLRRAGAKKKQLFAANIYNWWYNLQITSVTRKLPDNPFAEEVIGFKYYSSKGLARIEEEMIGVGLSKVDHLLQVQSQNSNWDKRLSKTLFEMLIPNAFKNVFRNQGNLILKLDKNAAQIPWELLHDPLADETPVAVTSTFLRQLVTGYGDDLTQVSLGNTNVLIVGDPMYGAEDLQQLPAAKAEGVWVAKQLSGHSYKTTSLINAASDLIMMELYSRKYKIMHFAGHGLYDPENEEVGIAIGNGFCIDPAMINQMGYTPEFVFINCCYSGTMDAEDDNYSRDRSRLAANVGTQLIEMGVKAIIISGWAVDDAAAKTFSEAFYKHMLEGYDFGSSVQKARLLCYQNHPGTNTWGAYQCYGNQFYKFNNRKKRKQDDLEYVIPSQVHVDLDNLLVAIRDGKHSASKTLSKLDRYLDKAEQANLLDALVLEKEALIYDELGKSDIALQKFMELFKYANGNFSIEALEQYCIIKTHNLHEKTLKEDLREIEFLTLVGKNPSRLNIVGNAYKYASIKAKTKKEKVAYLLHSFQYYEKAFSASTDRYDGGYLDALTNMVFLGYILELQGEQKLLDRLNESSAFAPIKDVEAYLRDFNKQLDDYDKDDLDVSVLIGMAETSYGLLLLKSNFKPTIELDIIDKFKHIFKLLYSPRYIRIELLHIDFLLHYFKDKTIRKQLVQIREEVEKLLDKP